MPVYINDELDFQVIVDQISLGTTSIVLKVNISRGKDVVAKGKIVVGFTTICKF